MDDLEVLERAFRGVLPSTPVGGIRATPQNPELLIVKAPTIGVTRIESGPDPMVGSWRDSDEVVVQDGIVSRSNTTKATTDSTIRRIMMTSSPRSHGLQPGQHVSKNLGIGRTLNGNGEFNTVYPRPIPIAEPIHYLVVGANGGHGV